MYKIWRKTALIWQVQRNELSAKPLELPIYWENHAGQEKHVTKKISRLRLHLSTQIFVAA